VRAGLLQGSEKTAKKKQASVQFLFRDEFRGPLDYALSIFSGPYQTGRSGVYGTSQFQSARRQRDECGGAFFEAIVRGS